MRNSLVPIVAAVVLFAVGLALIRPNVDRGQGGPEVHAGILRLPKRNPVRTGSLELSGSTAAHIVHGGRDQGRWRVVVIAGADREAATRAAMLALGEALYTANVVAIMDPIVSASDPSPPLPIPADRHIRVATSDAAIGDGPADAWKATVDFTISEPRLPDGHPAAGLQSAMHGPETRITVDHAGRAAAGATAGWPERWASTGRAIVQAMLSTLVPPPGLQRPEQHLVDWGSPVPFPPTTSELRWRGCFQQDLVRGWYGRIEGLTVTTSTGTSEAACAPLTRLLDRGAWQPVERSGGWELWSRLRDGQRQWFGMHGEHDGWALTMWCERPDLPGLVDGWLQQAKGGDALAREHLRRALEAPALPEPLRVRIGQAAQ